MMLSKTKLLNTKEFVNKIKNMDLEKNLQAQYDEVLQSEPVNNMGKWAKQTKLDSINEKIQWVTMVRDIIDDDYDENCGLDKETWTKGFIVGFARASEALKELEELKTENDNKEE